MSVANSTLASPAPARTGSFTVRLAPALVETLCELTRVARDKSQPQSSRAHSEISGLLFGRLEDGVATVEGLKPFKDSGPRSDLARRERLDKALEVTLGLALSDPELTQYHLIGWFSFRNSSGLLNSDVDFHNRHFKRPDDVALIVWREADTQIIAELYSKVGADKLSSEDYRWSSVRLSTEMRRLSEPIDLAMRVKISEDSYIRAYAGPDRAERREEWKKMALSAKRSVLSLLPKRSKSRDDGTLTTVHLNDPPAEPKGASSFDTRTLFRGMEPDQPPAKQPPAETAPLEQAEPEKSPVEKFMAAMAVAANARPAGSSAPKPPVREENGEVTGLPMVINTKRPRRAVPWLSTAIVFVLCCGVTFAFLAIQGRAGSGRISRIMHIIFPGADLGLRVESQGDRLLLSWNRRNSSVSSASEGILQIFDGPQRREIHLDGGQVADGSVLYKPVSGDVTFRLEVHGSDQTVAMGSMRVLDATSPAAIAHEGPVVDLSATTSQPAASPGNDLPPAVSVLPASKTSTGPLVRASGRARETITGQYPPPSFDTLSGRLADDKAGPAAEKTSTNPTAAQPADASSSPASSASAPQQSAAAAPAQTTPTPSPRVKPEYLRPPAPPPVNAGGATINGWDPNFNETPRAPAPRERDATPAGTPPDAKSTSFVAPRPLLQVMPNTRALAPGTVSQVIRVEVQVRIDDAGHVKSAHVINDGGTKSALTSAALAAARQWTFQPATYRGEKVESDHTIVFEFRPENQP